MSIKQGRVAIVTGAGQGIGEHIAKRLAAEGAFVAVCDIKGKKAKAVAQEILDAGHMAMAVSADVGSKEDCRRVVEEVVAKWGFLDILVNNAAVMHEVSLRKTGEKQWDEMFRVNLKGPFMMTQAVCGILQKQGYGRIINISDPACSGSVNRSAYAATKAGLNALTISHALELGRHGITVNSIFADDGAQSVRPLVEDTMAEIAENVYFLSSEESGYINGQVFSVGGGSHFTPNREANCLF